MYKEYFEKLENLKLSIFSKNLDTLRKTLDEAKDINFSTGLGLDEIEEHAKEYGKLVKGIRLAKKRMNVAFKLSRKFLENVDTKVKELGIKPNSIPDYKEYKKVFTELEKYEDIINSSIKRAERIRKMF